MSENHRYYRPIPLDYELLRRMPAEGASLGFHVLGMTVAHVTKELNKDAPQGGELTSSQIAGRVKAMSFVGYCVPVTVMGASGTLGWQRTPKGDQFLAEHDGTTASGTPALSLITHEQESTG